MTDSKPAPDTRPPIAPVAPADRTTSVDILRGFALLGILVINIVSFGLPMAVFFDPSVAGGFTGLNLLVWKLSSLLFLDKMMAVFSMLFGAGLVLMSARAESAGRKITGAWYRRILWLLVIGILHGYLFWYGDILYSYAICGLLFFPLRRRSPRALIIIALVVFAFGALLELGSGYQIGVLRRAASDIEARLDAGDTPTPMEKSLLDARDQFEDTFKNSPEAVAAETAAYRGSLSETFSFRVSETLMMQTQGFLFRVFWRAFGLMLLGMALMKLGVFSAERSYRFYIIMAVIGYGLGLPVVGHGIGRLLAGGFDLVDYFTVHARFAYFPNILVALAHVSVVMLVCKAGLFRRLTDRLAAVGRMALTNYLLHTLVFTTLFYGYGLGWFGNFNRVELMGFTAAMWLLQLYLSPLWLTRFRFGPAEWLWRTLTYLKMPPMRIRN